VLSVAAPGVLANDSDVDGDTLTVVIMQGPVNGTLVFNSDGSFTYTPGPNYYGTDSFVYQASDPSGASSIATATIVVHPVIDPPIAFDDYYTTPEDTTLNVVPPGVLSNDTDPEGGSLTAQIVQGPSVGSLSFSDDGSFTYEPVANFTGTDSFTYTATSTAGLAASATVTIEVTPVNDDPVVILGDGAVIDEGDTYSSNGLFIDPDGGDSWIATVDYGDGSGVQSLMLTDFEFALNHTYADNGLYTVTVTVSDMMGVGSAQLAVQVNNVAPDVGPITAPVDPVGENTPINVSADFTDPGILDTHTAVWDWGDGTTSPGSVSEINGSGSVTGNHAYAAPGVYTIILTVTDKDGDSGSSQYEFMVVHQVNSGFVTGGGWIDSPPGAYLAEPTATGKANFGFNAKYKKGANVPDGSTEFQFKAGNLNFHSNSYDWLLVAGARAQYKGEGTINGAGGYGFLLTVVDGQINGGGGIDKFRIKIWDKVSEVVIYDNQLGDSDDSQLSTVLGGGQIVIHSQ
jgi:VCBS repeat-containing protein